MALRPDSMDLWPDDMAGSPSFFLFGMVSWLQHGLLAENTAHGLEHGPMTLRHRPMMGAEDGWSMVKIMAAGPHTVGREHGLWRLHHNVAYSHGILPYSMGQWPRSIACGPIAYRLVEIEAYSL